MNPWTIIGWIVLAGIAFYVVLAVAAVASLR